MPEITWPFLIAGLVLCLGGWALYWVAIHLAGALLGTALGLILAWIVGLLANLKPPMDVWALPIGAVLGFALGIFLIRGIHRYLFFLIGSSLGLAAGHAFTTWGRAANLGWMAEAPQLWQWVFLIAGSILGGIALVRGSRWVMALATSLVGAFLIVTSVSEPLVLLAFIPLVVGSFLLQMGFFRRFTPRRIERTEPREE